MKRKIKGGDCYYIAGQFAMDNVFSPKKIDYKGTPYLVHAEVQGQGKVSNLRYGHAWIEDDENVYDFSNSRELIIPKVLYYAIGDIRTNNPKKYQKYTFSEARKRMLQYKHYGCWDLDVEYKEGGNVPEQYRLVRTPADAKMFYHGTGEVNNTKKALLNNSFIFHKSAGIENGMYLTPNKDLAIQYSTITNGNDKGVLEIHFKNTPNFKFYKNAGEQYDEESSFSNNPKEAIVKYREKLLKDGYDGIFTGENVYMLYKEKINLIDNINILGSKKSVYEKGGLIAPNGKKSNLTAEQYKLVRTPAFKKWFGDWENSPETASKVVDENGEPKVMWHGSPVMEEITIFKSSKGHDYNFFSDYRHESARYVPDYENVYPNERYNQALRKKYYDSKIKDFFIQSYNPFDYNRLSVDEKNNLNVFLENKKDELIDVIVEYAKNMGHKSLEDYLDDDDVLDKYASKIELLNYFLYYGGDDWWILETSVFQEYIKSNYYDSFVTKESGSWNIAVYNPNQSKLADGTNTTFDSNNPDIRYAEGGGVEEKLYRNTSIHWLNDFLKKGVALPNTTFISFSKEEDSGGMDSFGETNIEFSAKELYKQGAIEVEYNVDFFEENPKICMYVTGYKGEEDYYQQKGYQGKEDFEENGQDDFNTLMWETVIEDYEHEAEVVIKKLKYTDGLILSVNGEKFENNKSDSKKRIKKLDEGGDLTADFKHKYYHGTTIKNYQNLGKVNSIYFTPLYDDAVMYALMGNEANFERKLKKSNQDVINLIYENPKELLIKLFNKGDKPIILIYETNEDLTNNYEVTFPNLKKSDLEIKNINFSEFDKVSPIWVDLINYIPNWSEGGHIEEPTEFWGDSAAGVLLICKKTGRVLLFHRSEDVYEPETWGIISGKIDEDENPKDAILRELIEETELSEEDANRIVLKPSYVYKKGSFTFYNYLGFVENEFVPTLNWENTDYKWCDIGEYPNPLHFGVLKLLENVNLKKEISNFDSNNPDIRYNNGGLTMKAPKLLAPNGNPSNLTPEQYRLVRTPEFKAWFGDWENSPETASKIVDENGEPLICYHGTRNRFYIFDRNKGGQSNTLAKVGFWFTPIKVFADTFAEATYWDKGEAFSYATFLNIKNPKKYITEDYSDSVIYGDAYDKFKIDIYKIEGQSSLNAHIGMALKNENKTIDKYREFLNNEGYDGIYINNTNYDRLIARGKNDQIVALYPNQIKLADGTNTTFDSNNPDIRYEIGGIFQGTPHEFDKYSTDYMGTGEGQQVFGWGLYFTDIKDIAKQYAKNELLIEKEIAKKSNDSAHLWIYSNVPSQVKDKLAYLKNELNDLEEKQSQYPKLDLADKIKTYRDLIDIIENYKGKVYSVTLFKGENESDYDLLLWDSPVNVEQLEKIFIEAEKIGGIPLKEGWYFSETKYGITPELLAEGYSNVNLFDERSSVVKGDRLYSHLAKELGSDKEASLFLLRAGIDGIKYKSGTLSGMADKEGYNYVIFDANDATIESKEQFNNGGLTKLKAEDMLKNPLTIKFLNDLDSVEWVNQYHAKTKNYKPNTYYHVNTKGLNSGVGKGLYLGRDKEALISFYDLESEGKKVDTYIGNPNWLDLLNYEDYKNFEKQAIKKYGQNYIQKLSILDIDIRGEMLKKLAIDKGFDGIRYYDPQATGEEFVLFNTNKVKLADGTNIETDIRYNHGGNILPKNELIRKAYGWYSSFKDRYYKDLKSAHKDIERVVDFSNKQFGKIFGNDNSKDIINLFNFIETKKGIIVEPKIKQSVSKKKIEYITDSDLVNKEKQIWEYGHGIEIGRYLSKLQYIDTNDSRIYGTEKPKEEKIIKLMDKLKNGDELPPILLDYDFGILDGHHRFEASKRLGIKQIPIIIYEYPDEKYANGGSIPDLLSSQEVAYKLGRELHWWNDDIVSINGVKYKKVFLRPEYKVF